MCRGRGCFVMGSGSELIKEQLICKVEKQSYRSNKSCKNGKSIHRGITSPFWTFLTEVKKQMTNYLEVTNLSKSFDSFQLHNISFTLPKGYIMGLIGPNGSGKNNDNQTDFEYAQAHRRHSQSDGAG